MSKNSTILINVALSHIFSSSPLLFPPKLSTKSYISTYGSSVYRSFAPFLQNYACSKLEIHNSMFNSFISSFVICSSLCPSYVGETFVGVAFSFNDCGSSIELVLCTFRNIKGTQTGAVNSNVKLLVESCLFQNCSSSSHGGAVSAGSFTNINRCSFDQCSSVLNGGVIYFYSANSNLTIYDITTSQCSCGNEGSIVFYYSKYCSLIWIRSDTCYSSKNDSSLLYGSSLLSEIVHCYLSSPVGIKNRAVGFPTRSSSILTIQNSSFIGFETSNGDGSFLSSNSTIVILSWVSFSYSESYSSINLIYFNSLTKYQINYMILQLLPPAGGFNVINGGICENSFDDNPGVVYSTLENSSLSLPSNLIVVPIALIPSTPVPMVTYTPVPTLQQTLNANSADGTNFLGSFSLLEVVIIVFSSVIVFFGMIGGVFLFIKLINGECNEKHLDPNIYNTNI